MIKKHEGGKRMPQMVTIRQAAAETGLSYEFIRGLIREHKIVYVKAGCKFLVNRERLIEYLNHGEGMFTKDGTKTNDQQVSC